MPGNYSITTRVTGEVLTAAKYNADHQNHIDHFEPQYMDDMSSSVSAFRTKTDPGESGSESLPTTLAGEIERLRFGIYDVKNQLTGNTTYWYETPTIPKRNVKSYGAVGDGVTDDTTAFQTAIDVGGHIIVPPGIYSITSTLTISKGITIEGVGPAGGGINNASSAFKGAILQHNFSGTFIQILGVSGSGEQGVGTRLQNLVLQNNNGNGAGASGIAIYWYCTSDSYRATWLRIQDVHTEIVTGKNDWTYSFVADGDATSGFASGSARDLWIVGGRWYNDANATGCMYFRCAVNCFLSQVFLNGTKGNMSISGSDATHKSATFHMIGGGGADLSIDRLQNGMFSGTLWSNIDITNNAENITITGGNCTNRPTIGNTQTTTMYHGYVGTSSTPELITGTAGFIVKSADRQAMVNIDAPSGSNSILRLSKGGNTVWNINNNNATDSLRISSNTLAPVVEIAQSTGVLTHSYGIVNAITTATYSASITLDWRTANHFIISVTNGTGFSIASSNTTSGQHIFVTIKNVSGGAHGAISFTAMNLAAAAPTIANGFNQTLEFANVGGNIYEMNRTSGDVAN